MIISELVHFAGEDKVNTVLLLGTVIEGGRKLGTIQYSARNTCRTLSNRIIASVGRIRQSFGLCKFFPGGCGLEKGSDSSVPSGLIETSSTDLPNVLRGLWLTWPEINSNKWTRYANPFRCLMKWINKNRMQCIKINSPSVSLTKDTVEGEGGNCKRFCTVWKRFYGRRFVRQSEFISELIKSQNSFPDFVFGFPMRRGQFGDIAVFRLP